MPSDRTATPPFLFIDNGVREDQRDEGLQKPFFPSQEMTSGKIFYMAFPNVRRLRNLACLEGYSIDAKLKLPNLAVKLIITFNVRFLTVPRCFNPATLNLMPNESGCFRGTAPPQSLVYCRLLLFNTLEIGHRVWCVFRSTIDYRRSYDNYSVGLSYSHDTST